MVNQKKQLLIEMALACSSTKLELISILSSSITSQADKILDSLIKMWQMCSNTSVRGQRRSKQTYTLSILTILSSLSWKLSNWSSGRRFWFIALSQRSRNRSCWTILPARFTSTRFRAISASISKTDSVAATSESARSSCDSCLLQGLNFTERICSHSNAQKSNSLMKSSAQCLISWLRQKMTQKPVATSSRPEEENSWS